MRRSVLVLAALVGSTRAARAEDWSLHLVATADAGWTDNLFSAPATPPAGSDAPAKTSDEFLDLQPGALLTFATPRTIHELSYQLDANLYLHHSEAWGLLQRARWRGFFITSPRGELTTSVSGSVGDTSTFSTASAASTGQVTTQRSGALHVEAVDAAEGYTYAISPELRLTEGTVARFDQSDIETLGRTRSTELGETLGLDRSWRTDAIGLDVGASYLLLSRPEGTTQVSDDQVNLRARLSWRRDLSRHWTSVVDGGGVVVVPTGGTGKTAVEPTIGGQLGYFPVWGTATIQVRRDVQPNLFIAQNTVTNSASASCWLPLPWLRENPTSPRLTVQATVGVAHVDLIDSTGGGTVSAFDDVLGDVAVAYSIRHALGVGLRYQLLYQNADPNLQTPVFDFTRNSVLVTFFGQWPEREAAKVPIRQSLRVDRSNLTPVGTESQGTGGTGGGR
jgi:hypothetical protein